MPTLLHLQHYHKSKTMPYYIVLNLGKMQYSRSITENISLLIYLFCIAVGVTHSFLLSKITVEKPSCQCLHNFKWRKRIYVMSVHLFSLPKEMAYYPRVHSDVLIILTMLSVFNWPWRRVARNHCKSTLFIHVADPCTETFLLFIFMRHLLFQAYLLKYIISNCCLL